MPLLPGVEGVSEASNKGPELTGIAKKAIGRKPDMPAEDYLRESILIPNAYYAEGFAPQEAGVLCGAVLSISALDRVVAFLLTLH
jgi:hypothetical protein